MPNQPEYTQHDYSKCADCKQTLSPEDTYRCDYCIEKLRTANAQHERDEMADHEDACNCQACLMDERNNLDARIAELEAEAKASMQQHDSLCHKLMDAEEEIKRLRGIVERLPTDALGNPVTLLQNVFVLGPSMADPNGLGFEAGFVVMNEPDSPDGEWWGVVRDSDGCESSCCVHHCYPSREAFLAAEAARGKP